MVLPKSEACPVMLLFSFAEVLFRHSGSIVKIPFAYDIVAVKHRPCLASHDRVVSQFESDNTGEQ